MTKHFFTATQAAERCGMSTRAFFRWVEALGIEADKFVVGCRSRHLFSIAHIEAVQNRNVGKAGKPKGKAWRTG